MCRWMNPRIRRNLAASLALDLHRKLDAWQALAAREPGNRCLNDANPLSELNLGYAGSLEKR